MQLGAFIQLLLTLTAVCSRMDMLLSELQDVLSIFSITCHDILETLNVSLFVHSTNLLIPSYSDQSTHACTPKVPTEILAQGLLYDPKPVLRVDEKTKLEGFKSIIRSNPPALALDTPTIPLVLPQTVVPLDGT